jgi:tight adherence protein C
MQLLFFVAVAFTGFCVLALAVLPFVLKPSTQAARMMELVTSTRPDKRTVRVKEQTQEKLLAIARDVRARLGLGENTKLKIRLQAAGMRDASTPDVFFAAQLIVPLVGAFAASFIPQNTLFWVMALAGVGYLMPDMWLTRMIKRRTKRIRRSIPDAVDLLAICVEAGLGMDQALLRVGDEIALSHPDINEEFTQVNLEQRAGTQRLEAWNNLAARTQMEEFKSFVSMLTQSDKFGTPILKALNRFSEDLRTKRRQAAEEAAAKTKIKIIFPLVLFIFPCLFIVLLAPAIMSIAVGLKGMAGN